MSDEMFKGFIISEKTLLLYIINPEDKFIKNPENALFVKSAINLNELLLLLCPYFILLSLEDDLPNLVLIFCLFETFYI